MKFIFTVILFFIGIITMMLNSCKDDCEFKPINFVTDSISADIYKVSGIEMVNEDRFLLSKIYSKDTVSMAYDSIFIELQLFDKIALKSKSILNENCNLYACSPPINYIKINEIEIFSNLDYNSFPKGQNLNNLFSLHPNGILIGSALNNIHYLKSTNQNFIKLSVPPSKKTLLELKIIVTTENNKKLVSTLPPFYVY